MRKEAISEEHNLEESVLDGEGAGEKNVSGEFPKYKKKFREHAQIPKDDSLTGQKKKSEKADPETAEKRAGKIRKVIL